MLQLSDEDQAEFREIFGLVDTDGSGKISPSELGQLTKKLGLNYSEVYNPSSFIHSPIYNRNNWSKWSEKLILTVTVK